jgi:hypothetical protein
LKRIAFASVNDSVAWGGSEACWAAAAERFAREGTQVFVSVRQWPSPVKQVEQLRAAGCEILYRGAKPLLWRAARRTLSKQKYPWAEVADIGNRADLLVISQGGTSDGLLWLEAAKAQGIPYAVIVQSVSEQWWPKDGLVEQLATAYEGARAAYFVSGANLALCRKQFVSPLPRGRVIRNPFNVRYDASPSWPEGHGGDLRLACVARLDMVQKAQDLLLDVLALPHWRARDVRLTFVGSGVNERSLRRMAERSKLANVSFAGFVEDIEQIWSTHHALVLASRFEGTPLALVEAMLCGRACIATDVGGNGELIRDGVNGFLAKAPTVELLDEAMNRAWESRGRLREMGEAAGRDVREWVTPDPMEDFVRDLNVLVDGSGRSASDGDGGAYVVGRPASAMGDAVTQSAGRSAV